MEFHHYPSSDNKYLRIVKTLAPITDEHETSYSKLDGLTPLQVAIKRGNSEIVKILAPFTNTRSNADISVNGYTTTLINLAADNGHADVISE